MEADRGVGTVRLRVSCPDRPGAAVSGLLYDRGLNIVDAEQHSTGDRFFLGVEAIVPPDGTAGELRNAFADTASRFEMDWGLTEPDREKRVAIFVSRDGHCLNDLLWRFERIGRDIERVVLARAVKWHLEDRVLVDGPRTVVFR